MTGSNILEIVNVNEPLANGTPQVSQVIPNNQLSTGTRLFDDSVDLTDLSEVSTVELTLSKRSITTIGQEAKLTTNISMFYRITS